MKLFVRPLLIALIATSLWLSLRYGVGQYLNDDEGVLVSGTIAFLAVVYALLTGLTLVTVWGQWNTVQDALHKKDREAFDTMKTKRIPGTLKALLFLFSSLLLGAFWLVSFTHAVAGGYTIFAVSIVLAVAWEVIMDLDDPFEGVWNIDPKEIPEEWKA